MIISFLLYTSLFIRHHKQNFFYHNNDSITVPFCFSVYVRIYSYTSVDCCADNIVEIFKMPHIFTNVEYADMLYVYGFCDGSATAAVEEYRRRFPTRRIPDRRVFSKVFNTLRESGTLPSVHTSSERGRQQSVEEQENIIEMVHRSPTTSMRRIAARLGVPKTRVWKTLHEDSLYPFHLQHVQNLHRGDSAVRLQFCQ
jgi:hypothetical protein